MKHDADRFCFAPICCYTITDTDARCAGSALWGLAEQVRLTNPSLCMTSLSVAAREQVGRKHGRDDAKFSCATRKVAIGMETAFVASRFRPSKPLLIRGETTAALGGVQSTAGRPREGTGAWQPHVEDRRPVDPDEQLETDHRHRFPSEFPSNDQLRGVAHILTLNSPEAVCVRVASDRYAPKPVVTVGAAGIGLPSPHSADGRTQRAATFTDSTGLASMFSGQEDIHDEQRKSKDNVKILSRSADSGRLTRCGISDCTHAEFFSCSGRRVSV